MTMSTLAEGFAEHAGRWARQAGANDEGARLAKAVAGLVCEETLDGHVCAHADALPTPWQEMPPDALGAALYATGIVSTGDGVPTPLVADSAGRIYLWRYFDYERRLAAGLARLAHSIPINRAHHADMANSLDQLFPDTGKTQNRQKLAAALALTRGLCVISGGPGTGKTHTVVGLLAVLLASKPDTRIALAAPTGKAAARMMETLRARVAGLPPPIRERLPQEAMTVHRLLGVTGETGRFRHHRENPLPIDALIVDEASMLDLALATHLVEAIPSGARLILLGDKDQLAAVEAGAVFAELSAGQHFSPDCASELAALCRSTTLPSSESGRTTIPDAVVWLTESRRFHADSGIGRLAAGIKAGRGSEARTWLEANRDRAVCWIDDLQETPSEHCRATILAGYAPYFAALADPAQGKDPQALFEAFSRYQILCAVQAGPRGVGAMNTFVGERVRHRTTTGGSPWYRGRAVMILRNDYALRVFNGDIGICVPDEDGALVVAFPDADDTWRRLTPSRLPEHADAFAMTVHKSQGSEFERVHLMLPERASATLTRELVYTAVTRATTAVEISGRAEVFTTACSAPTVRRSGLATRLTELARAP